MKRIIYFALFILCSGMASAQQLPHFTQYLINDYVINPALGGTKDYQEVRSNHRYQWVGITDAPRTYILSYNAPSPNRKVGYGGYVYSDITGPTRRTGFNLSYAYQFKVTDNTKLSLGLYAGLLQFRIDGNRVSLKDAGDLALSSDVNTALIPDATFGFHYYGEKFFVGAALPQLLSNKIKFDTRYTGKGNLVTHAYVTAGYKHNLTEAIAIQPSFLMKYSSPVPLQFDISMRAFYKELIWIGGSFRPDEGFSGLVGFSVNQNIALAYSYDYSTTNIQNYTSGSHEVMVGLKFPTKKTAPPEPSIKTE